MTQNFYDRLARCSCAARPSFSSKVASVALKKHRKGFPDIVTDDLAQYADLDINLYRVEPQDAVALALRYKLSAYDAAYLWLAAELKATLATFDEKLGRAAQLHLASLS